MTEVELLSPEYAMIMKWFNVIYSANQKEPTKDEVWLFRKLEVLQEAAKLIDDLVDDLTK